ncbi:hypothetical protein NAG22_04345 [Pseudomonas aeruginosa]|nr:hypothetical protein [Pseudomonas aeruginosa]
MALGAEHRQLRRLAAYLGHDHVDRQAFADAQLDVLAAQPQAGDVVAQLDVGLEFLLVDVMLDAVFLDPRITHHALGERLEGMQRGEAGGVEEAELAGHLHRARRGRREVQRQQHPAVLLFRRTGRAQHRDLRIAYHPLQGGADEQIAQRRVPVRAHHQQVGADLLGHRVDHHHRIADPHDRLGLDAEALLQGLSVHFQQVGDGQPLRRDQHRRLVVVEHVQHGQFGIPRLGQRRGAHDRQLRTRGQVGRHQDSFHLPPPLAER